MRLCKYVLLRNILQIGLARSSPMHCLFQLSAHVLVFIIFTQMQFHTAGCMDRICLILNLSQLLNTFFVHMFCDSFVLSKSQCNSLTILQLFAIVQEYCVGYTIILKNENCLGNQHVCTANVIRKEHKRSKKFACKTCVYFVINRYK